MKFKGHLTIFLVLLILQVFKISAQQAYNDISVGQRVSIFSEAFENNNNNWITDNSFISGKFINGNYDITCKNFKQNTGLTYLPISIDQAKDFELETSFTIIKGNGALVFGLTEDLAHYRVEIDEKKNLVIFKNTPSKNKVEKIFSGKEEAVIKDIGFYNKLTVRKLQGSYYIFINDILIKQLNNLILAGDQVGFSVGLSSEISVDYLNVSYLKSQTAPIMAERNVAKTDSAKTPPVNVAAVIPAPKDTLNTTRQNEIKVSPPAPAPTAGPVITWVSPSGLTTMLDSYNNMVRVRVSIKSASEVRSALFYVNGASRGDGDIRPGENGTFIAEKLITLNTGDNNVYMVATSVDGTSKMSDTRYFTNPLASLPEIKWKVPLNAVESTNTEKITLEVCIKSGADLASANVWVNGNQFSVARVFQRLNNDSCNYIWKPQVILKEGDNSIFVNAENSVGSVSSENRIIKFARGIAEKRLALVIGNSDYNNSTSLKNPMNDANLMEAHLKNLGFTVTKQLNCKKDSMLNAIKEFSRKLNEYNVALFYYAGHGVQVDGVNYLIPVDAKLEHKEDVSFDAVPVTMVTDQLKRNSANTNIVILDACRNNPYKSWARGGEAGFRALGPINGTIISFATSEGATAADGDGRNGLFTEELVKQMEIPQSITSVFINTRKEVLAKSNGQQMPAEWVYLTGEFYFKK